MTDDIWDKLTETIRPLGKKMKQPAIKTCEPILIDRPLYTFSHEDSKPSFQSFPFLEKGKMMDTNRTTAEKLKKGEITIEARLDLHGMTIERAKQKLEEFIVECHREQKRYILVITGRGARGEGVIYREIARWLNQPLLRPYIIAFTAAHPKDGGEGALYVLLKNKKKL